MFSTSLCQMYELCEKGSTSEWWPLKKPKKQKMLCCPRRSGIHLQACLMRCYKVRTFRIFGDTCVFLPLVRSQRAKNLFESNPHGFKTLFKTADIKTCQLIQLSFIYAKIRRGGTVSNNLYLQRRFIDLSLRYIPTWCVSLHYCSDNAPMVQKEHKKY